MERVGWSESDGVCRMERACLMERVGLSVSDGASRMERVGWSVSDGACRMERVQWGVSDARWSVSDGASRGWSVSDGARQRVAACGARSPLFRPCARPLHVLLRRARRHCVLPVRTRCTHDPLRVVWGARVMLRARM